MNCKPNCPCGQNPERRPVPAGNEQPAVQDQSPAEGDALARALEACPFCGDKDIAHRAIDGREFVMCSNCGADMDSLNVDGDVRAAWNRRATANVQPKSTAETCAICGDGKALMVRVCDQCGSEYAGSAEMRANTHSKALEQISEKLTIMLASAQAHSDGDWITGYTIKTGALHSIIGILTGLGVPVEVPLPATQAPAPVDEVHELMSMTEAQIDNELRTLGIDPATAAQKAGEAVAGALRRSGGYTCGMCGKASPHEHTPDEVVIFGNGLKRGASQAPAVKDGWRPIETAPQDGTTVLTFRMLNGEPQIADARYFEATGCWGQRSWRYPDGMGPTHWMPLPAAPAFDVPVQGSGQ